MSTCASPHPYPPFIIICHHHYSPCTFAPRVSLSYNKPAFPYSRATHHRTTSSSSRPSLVSSNRQSNLYNPVSHLRSSTMVFASTLDPHPVISLRLITGSGVHTKCLVLCVYVPQSFLLLFSFSWVFIPFSALDITCGRCGLHDQALYPSFRRSGNDYSIRHDEWWMPVAHGAWCRTPPIKHVGQVTLGKYFVV